MLMLQSNEGAGSEQQQQTQLQLFTFPCNVYFQLVLVGRLLLNHLFTTDCAEQQSQWKEWQER